MSARIPEWIALLGFLACAACERQGQTSDGDALVKQVKLGIFFGGQVQERQEIPFVVERSRQAQGFRIDLRDPSERALEVYWEVDMPRGSTRVTKLEHATLRPGQKSFDQEITFQSGDQPGLWNVRVFVEKRLLLDRAISVTSGSSARPDPVGDFDDLP